jgi:hypothetical protein
MRIIKLEEDMSKFKPENKEIEVENMRSFVTKYKVRIHHCVLKVSQHLVTQSFFNAAFCFLLLDNIKL